MDLTGYVADGTLVPLQATHVCEIKGLATDSRKVESGFAFVAIPGHTVDGADFIPTALEKGATVIITASDVDESKITPYLSKALFFKSSNIRKTLGQLAADFYGQQPATCVAVTGTNGKTSTVTFLRQAWAQLGYQAASIGTLGVQIEEGHRCPTPISQGSLTSLDPLALHSTLKELKGEGVDHLALEASSHGLDQYRLEGVQVGVSIWTNLTQDHLDYHGTLEDYFQAKLKLFTELMDPSGVAIINLDDAYGARVLEACLARGVRTLTFGHGDCDLQIISLTPQQEGQTVEVRLGGTVHSLFIPLAGAFQVHNVLGVMGALMASGVDLNEIIETLSTLQGVPGRLQQAAPGVYVDYAHTPDALELSLSALRSHCEGRLIVVFGCGGDRDAAKRPLMGEIAAQLADVVIVTDDNPRSEVPAAIRAQILKAVPRATEIGDRAQAIRFALTLKGDKDLVLIAGKGHENYQIYGTDKRHFDDGEEVMKVTTLWTAEEIFSCLDVPINCEPLTGVSIDTRTLNPGDLFVALKGETGDGHDFVEAAYQAGAGAALISHSSTHVHDIIVADPLKALETLGIAARDRAQDATRIAVTGSMGKTGVKDMLRLVLGEQASSHASVASYNNHWGVPLTLARMPRQTRYGIFEVGMNHPGEIGPLAQMIKPHVSIITAIGESHIGFFKSQEEIARAKSEIFEGGAQRVLIKGNTPQIDLLIELAKAQNVPHIHLFGQGSHFECHLVSVDLKPTESHVVASIFGSNVDYTIPLPGIHLVENSLAVLGAVHLAGGDVKKAARDLQDYKPSHGRGERMEIPFQGGTITLVDESYNANPSSMKAALAVLGTAPGRKIAVIGDMRELGEQSQAFHEGLKPFIIDNNIDRVFCCGPFMAFLFDSLPAAVKAGYTETSTQLIPLVLADLQAGDTVMVKGSLGTRMKPIVEAILALKNNNKQGSAQATR